MCGGHVFRVFFVVAWQLLAVCARLETLAWSSVGVKRWAAMMWEGKVLCKSF